MKKLIVIMIVLLTGCLSLQPSASGSLNPDWIPAHSKWVIHFDQALFSQTRLFSILDRNWRRDKDSIRSEILDELDIDITKDLKGLTVVGFDNIDKSDKVMVVLQGSFDQSRLSKRIRNKEKDVLAKVIAGVQVLCWDGDNRLFFPEKDVMVFCESKGDIAELVNLYQGKTKPVSTSSPLLRMLSEAPRNAFVKAAVTDISRLTRFAPKTMVLDSASVAFFMALESRENLSMLLKLVTESDKKAQNLQQVISGLLALVNLKMLNDDKDDDEARFFELLNGLKVTTEGNRLIMDFNYPVDKIGELVEKLEEKKTKVHEEPSADVKKTK